MNFIQVILASLFATSLMDGVAAQGSLGEFARITAKPAACEKIQGRQLHVRGSNTRRGPDCQMLLQCGEALLLRSRELVNFLERNPSIVTAIRAYERELYPSRQPNIERLGRFKSYLEAYGGRGFEEEARRKSSYVPSMCDAELVTIDRDFIRIERGSYIPDLEAIAAAGKATLDKARAHYRSDTAEYPELIAVVDKYAGVATLERAYAAYGRAFEDDDFAGLIRERPTILKALEQAKARKQLLTQQSTQITRYDQMLLDLVTVLKQESLEKFVDQQTPANLSELQNELTQLGHRTPAERGDIATRLDIISTGIRDIDKAIEAARSAKEKNEQIRKSLLQDEGSVQRILARVAGAELKPAFDDQFANSAKQLIEKIRELTSLNLESIRDNHEEVATAKVKLEFLQKQVSEAQAKYDRAKTLDQLRLKVLQNASTTLNEFARPDYRNKLSADGVSVVTKLQREADALLELDTTPLVIRQDYTDAVTAAEKTVNECQQFKTEIAQLTELTEGLRRLDGRIDQRGRNLLDSSSLSQLVELNNSARTLTTIKVPITGDGRRQLTAAQALLGQLETSIDVVMDTEEKRILVRNLPQQSGRWIFQFDIDKITDEELVRAVGTFDGLQAKYQLFVECRTNRPKLLISTFESRGTESKRIPWKLNLGIEPYETIRLRIDSNRAFRTRLSMHGYGNHGQVDLGAEFLNLTHSSRLVFADIFPDEQVEISTEYPTQFKRLCEILSGRSTRRGHQ